MPDAKEIDWTGVGPRTDPIPPLTAETFVQRLESLSAALAAVSKLREALVAQHPEYADRLPEDSQSADRRRG